MYMMYVCMYVCIASVEMVHDVYNIIYCIRTTVHLWLHTLARVQHDVCYELVVCILASSKI